MLEILEVSVARIGGKLQSIGENKTNQLHIKGPELNKMKNN